MTGEELKTIRETAGLAKGVFAKTIGITPLMQGRYEGGKISIPDSVAEAVAKAYSPSKNQIADAVKEEITRLVSDFNAGSDEKFDLGSIEVTVKEEPGSENALINKEDKKPAPKKQTAKKQAAKDKEVPARKENPAKAKKPSTTKVFIESMLGGSITTEEILKKIPKGTTEVYVKPEENKAYWVKGDKTGSVDLW